MSYLNAIIVFLMVLLPVLLPAAITGFHAVARVLQNWRIALNPTIADPPRKAASHAV